MPKELPFDFCYVLRERNRGKVLNSTVIYQCRFEEMKNIHKAACARTASIFRAYRELVAALSISAIYSIVLKFDFLSLRTLQKSNGSSFGIEINQ